MGHNLRTQEAIALGETEGREFYDIIQDSHTFGWMTFDQSITRAYEGDVISEETATQFATRKGVVQRHIDQVKKQRGLAKETHSGLRLDGVPPPGTSPTSQDASKRGFFGL